MAKKLEEIVAKIPPERQKKIEARARELIVEQMTLQDLRKARELTQERVAELLNIRQDSVSRLEKRTDLLLSTLRGYVEAMGGKLQLTVEFPDRPPVTLAGLSGTEEEDF